MTEWNIVEVIAALIGLFLTVGLPIVKLISSITRLTLTVESIQHNIDSVTSRNADSHRRMWNKLDEHGKMIGDQDGRIKKLEGKVDAYHVHELH